MEEDKKYWWIKINKDFFADDSPIDALLGMPNGNGSEYVCLYLKLCLNTMNKDGRLCNSIGEMLIPYDIDKITRDMKYFSRDTVRVAMEMYQKLGLIYQQEDGVFAISNYENMVGCETKYAEKMRKYRKGLKEKKDYNVADNVTYNVRQEIRDKSKELRDKSKDIRDKSLESRVEVPQGENPDEYNFDKHTNVVNFNWLINHNDEVGNYVLENTLLESVLKEWCKYKDELKPKSRNHYGETGLTSLIRKAIEYDQKCGTEAVQRVIESSISSTYQGITWDRLDKGQQDKPKEKLLDKWLNA